MFTCIPSNDPQNNDMPNGDRAFVASLRLFFVHAWLSNEANDFDHFVRECFEAELRQFISLNLPPTSKSEKSFEKIREYLELNQASAI